VVIDAPDAGDLVWLNFTPHAGREQAGKRPGLVLSPRAYNEKVGLMLACTITTKSTGYVFEVKLPADSPVQGVILSDHVKSVDWQARSATVAGRATDETIADVLAKLKALLQMA